MDQNTVTTTTWFIYTGDNPLANSIINDSGKIGQDDECPEMMCADGKSRDLYRCPDHQFIVEFERTARNIQPVTYKIYVKQGVNGQIREWSFPKRKKLNFRRKMHVVHK